MLHQAFEEKINERFFVFICDLSSNENVSNSVNGCGCPNFPTDDFFIYYLQNSCVLYMPHYPIHYRQKIYTVCDHALLAHDVELQKLYFCCVW